MLKRFLIALLGLYVCIAWGQVFVDQSGRVIIINGAAVAANSGLRFHPGFFANFDYSGGVTLTTLGTMGSGHDLDIINGTTTTTTLGMPPDNLMGFSFRIGWTSLDTGTSSPSYQWATVDAYKNAIEAKGKQWWLWIDPYSQYTGSGGSSVTTGNLSVPPWLANNSTGAYGAGNPGNVEANFETGSATCCAGTFPKWYVAADVTAMNGLMQAAAARYDSDPYFEGIAFGNGSATLSWNNTDSLGSSWSHQNYNSDFSNSGMVAAYQSMAATWRTYFTHGQIWIQTDYLFNEATSTSFTGQDVDLTNLFNTLVTNKGAAGGVDSWTATWVPPQTPLSQITENAYGTITNGSYFRPIYSDEVLRGWRAASPGTTTGYLNKVVRVGSEELTEMGGYIGQFAASDVYGAIRNPIDEVHYMFFDVNYSYTGNYGINTSPNTLWLATTGYDSTYGQSVYRYIQGAGATNTTNPY